MDIEQDEGRAFDTAVQANYLAPVFAHLKQ